MNYARELAACGNFAVAVLALGPGATQEELDELSMLTLHCQQVQHQKIYVPALRRVHLSIRGEDVERTASAFRLYLDARRFFGHGPRLEDDLSGVAQSIFEFILEPMVMMALRAEEASDTEGARSHLDLAEESAKVIGINIPNMVQVTRKHYAARLARDSMLATNNVICR